MNKITIHNYEAYLLDFLEGNLDQTLKKEMEKFLIQNPGIKDEIEDFDRIQIIPKPVKFQNKIGLLKSDVSEEMGISYIDYLCIADIENDTNEEEKESLNKILKSKKELVKLYSTYQKTKLQPDKSVVFPEKKHLMKSNIQLNFSTISSIAAAIIVLFMIINKTGVFKDQANSNGFMLSAVKLIDQTKPVTYKQLTNDLTIKQDLKNSHNQTDKQIHSNDLAFNDTEPLDEDNKYKETTYFIIPDIKTEARIFDLTQPEPDYSYFASNYQLQNDTKNIFWKSAEKGVDLWKLLTSDDDLVMNNKYKKDGSIDRLAISTTNLKFSRTFNKTNSQFVINQ